MKMRTHARTIAAAATGLMLMAGNHAQAHCDTMSGPLIPEARQALEKGDVTPILKWVMPGDEAEIKAAFAQAVAVRATGTEAQKLADRYFLETLVRIHRAGEGAPYTGLKDEPVDPIVALADNALADGSADDMIAKLSRHMAHAVEEKYNRALEARKHKDESVEAGREYVEAYVIYMHYVEGLHNAILSAGGHEHGDAAHAQHND
ncbi:DUF6448 family protein [Pontiella sp.]|uniref:DUF6448 family protein n=1 Tax=Pontiella sp. TaxID=2837462 RepID=UPI0035683E3E